MSNTSKDYQSLSRRLDEILASMQSPDITVDEAIALYKEGSKLVEGLQRYLQDAEVRITKLKS